MLYAKTNIDTPIKTTASPGAAGFCPHCDTPTIAKCGEIKAWHWAHKQRTNCDPWSEPESPWHLWWKEQVEQKNCEVTIEKDGIRHRADIATPDGIIVELQHSSISPAVIAEREQFYDRMVWLFDTKPFTQNFRLLDNEQLRWKYPRRSILSAKKPTFFDLGETKWTRIKKDARVVTALARIGANVGGIDRSLLKEPLSKSLAPENESGHILCELGGITEFREHKGFYNLCHKNKERIYWLRERSSCGYGQVISFDEFRDALCSKMAGFYERASQIDVLSQLKPSSELPSPYRELATTNDEPWEREPETDWHLYWKKQIPIGNYCVTARKGGTVHAADIVTPDNVVVELQQSTVSKETVRTREAFYDKMVWLVDASFFSRNLGFFNTKRSRYKGHVALRWHILRNDIHAGGTWGSWGWIFATKKPIFLDLGEEKHIQINDKTRIMTILQFLKIKKEKYSQYIQKKTIHDITLPHGTLEGILSEATGDAQIKKNRMHDYVLSRKRSKDRRIFWMKTRTINVIYGKFIPFDSFVSYLRNGTAPSSLSVSNEARP